MRCVLVLGLLFGCSPDGASTVDAGLPDAGSDATPEPFIEICNGQPGLRLAYQVLGGGPLDPEETVQWENGHVYLFIDGTCGYWVMTHSSEEVRHGTLSPDAADDLSRDLHYGSWSALAGDWLGMFGIPDASAQRFHDGTSVIHCIWFCDRADVPIEVQEMRDRIDSWTMTLWTDGAPVEGPMRLTAVAFGEEPTYPVAESPWPLAWDVAGIALTEIEAQMLGPGSSHLVDDPADTAALRELRRSYQAGEHGFYTWEYLPLRAAIGQLYRVYLRDTTPLEDATGLVPSP